MLSFEISMHLCETFALTFSDRRLLAARGDLCVLVSIVRFNCRHCPFVVTKTMYARRSQMVKTYPKEIPRLQQVHFSAYRSNSHDTPCSSPSFPDYSPVLFLNGTFHPPN